MMNSPTALARKASVSPRTTRQTYKKTTTTAAKSAAGAVVDVPRARRAARAVSATAAASADAAAGAAAGAEGAACAAGVSLVPRAARAASATAAVSTVAAAGVAGASSGSLHPTNQPVSRPAAVASAPGGASSSPRPASHLFSQPARSPVRRAPLRVPPPHLPPDLPATASEVQDLTSLSRVVTLLTTSIGKAVYDGKSVTTSNKRLIALAAEEARRAVAAFERLAPQPPPAAATVAAGVLEATTRAAAPPTGATTAAPDACTLSAELAACVKEVRLLRGDLSAAAKATRSLTATAAPSYAQMAGRPAGARRPPRGSPDAAAPTVAAPSAPPPTTTPRPAIIVAPKEPVSSRQEAVSAWRDSISFKNSRFAPMRVQPLSNGKLRVEFETVGQRDETLTRLRGSGKVTAEPARRTRPMFILKGISREITAEELVGVLKHQNPGVGDLDRHDDIEIRFLRNNKNPKFYNAVLTADPESWRKALSIERVNIDHQKVRVHNFTPFVQCRVCLQFGHTSRYCGRGTSAPCAYCASAAHNLVDCPEKERKASPRCFNCVARNERYNSRGDVAHTANSPSCPVLRAMRARVESNIDYGS